MVNIEAYCKVLELKKLGKTANEISNELNVNIHSINNWNKGKGILKYEKKIRGEYARIKIDKGVNISPIDYLLMISKISDHSELFKIYSYIFGLYLGDGNITNFKRTKALCITLDNKYSNLNENVINSFKLLFSDVRIFIRKSNCIDVRYYDCNLGLLFPQDSPGLKCDRQIIIEDWQSSILDPVELLRGLIMSDGSYYMIKSNNHFEYNFANCSIDIIKIACKCLDILKITYGLRSLPAKIKNHHNAFKITISAKDSVSKLHYYIGDKTNIRNRQDVDFVGYYGEYNDVKSFRNIFHTKLAKNII